MNKNHPPTSIFRLHPIETVFPLFPLFFPSPRLLLQVKYDPPLELGPAPTDSLGRKGAKPLKPNSLKAGDSPPGVDGTPHSTKRTNEHRVAAKLWFHPIFCRFLLGIE